MTTIVLFAVGAGLAGCSPRPLAASEMREPELRLIHAAFAEAVEAAFNDPNTSWHSGWFGNVMANMSGGRRRGLCHQWQERIYREVSPVVGEVGWEACGIAVNRGTAGEHHAVVVYDPHQCADTDLLESKVDAGAFVLDAWRHGRPDVYHLADWLSIPLLILAPAELEDLENDETGRQAPIEAGEHAAGGVGTGER